MDWYGADTLAQTPLTNITLANGTAVAAVANVDNFTFAYVPILVVLLEICVRTWLTKSFARRRVYAAGHEVAAFQPAAALAIFTQVIDGEQVHSV